MSKQNKKPLVPRLRFPEFRESEGWEAHAFREIVTRSFYGTSSATSDSGTYPVLRMGNMVDGGLDISNLTFINLTEEDFNKFELKHGDILLNRTNSIDLVGKISLFELNGKYIAASYLVAFRLRSDIIVPKYCNYLLNSDTYKYRIRSFATRAVSQANINPTTFQEELTILFPSHPEQQKIADCLSSLDELITAESKKLEAYKAHKKGLMQKLFPAEGKTVPEWRFPEFRDKGAWEEKLIEDFFLVGSSKRVLQEDWTTHGVPFYRTRELVSLSKNEPFSSEIFIAEELFFEIAQKYGLPKEGDFLVSGVGTLGISYQVQAGDKFYFKDGNVLWFKFKKGLVSTYFKYCFQSDGIQDQISGQASISTVGTYTIQNAKKTKFWYPPDSKEQQKIADCLTSHDELITAQAQKVETLKAHKKGLMQGLFPSADEVGA